MLTISQAIPDLRRLLIAIDSRCINPDSSVHGPAHWRCVAWTGLELLQSERDADPAVVLLFAMFHDTMRENDGHDPRHGPRAAVFAQSLHGKCFHLADGQLDRLIEACRVHTHATRVNDPTIAVCLDADRLNLWRIGVTPMEKFLSTAAARQADVIERASKLSGQRRDWPEIVEAYHAAAFSDCEWER